MAEQIAFIDDVIIEKGLVKNNFSFSDDVLAILLRDKTTNKNIKWATDSYERYGSRYESEKPICLDQVNDASSCVVRPRRDKHHNEQKRRSKKEAEVFTPLWICNAQNNLIDNAWFNSSGMFNTELEKSWCESSTPVSFPDSKTWIDYVRSTRMEVSCGEAPYLVSRHDVITGEYIPVSKRIGLLDRKLRVVGENVNSIDEWLYWATKSLKSIYGYDWQGDNVFLARINILLTMCDYYEHLYNLKLPHEWELRFARILSWNIWQMDGIKCVVPNSCKTYSRTIDTMFGPLKDEVKCVGCAKKMVREHNGIYCKIMDWDERKSILFIDLLEK